MKREVEGRKGWMGGRQGRVVLRWMSGWVLIWVCRNSICRLGAVCFFEITPSSSRLRSSAQSARERGRRSGRCLSEGDLMFSETTLSSHKHRFPSSPLSPYHSSTHHSPYLNSLHTALSRSTPLVPRQSTTQYSRAKTLMPDSTTQHQQTIRGGATPSRRDTTYIQVACPTGLQHTKSTSYHHHLMRPRR